MSLLLTTVARADEYEDFEQARSAYDRQQFARAVQLFEALVGSEPPRLQSRLLVSESRKYLGAAYLFVDRRSDAERQFELLIRAEPDYVLDELAFSRAVVEVFREVETHVRLEREHEQEVAAAAEEARLAREREERERERARLAAAGVGTEIVVRENSRWIATIPFGVGQFQNGDDALGVTLAVSSGVLFATSLVTGILHESLRDERPSGSDRAQAETLEQAFRYTNIGANLALLAVAIVGIVDAHVRFVPRVELERSTSPVTFDATGVTIRF